MRGCLLAGVVFTVLFHFSSVGVLAQETLGGVRGTVRAQAGHPIPGAEVTAKNLATGTSHKVSSNGKGEFEILRLESGVYAIQVTGPGFRSPAPRQIELGPGHAAVLEFLLEPSLGDTERKTESAGADASGSPSAGMANMIGEDQLAGLPLNGRSYSQLATLQAGVSDSSSASGSRGVGGGGLTVAGGRSTSNSFLLDGTNIMDTNNQVPRSAAGVQLGSDAVFEVQVFAVNYGANYGRGSGGVLNSITHSGTPQWHGSFFEFFRNSKLDARNFFDPGAEPTPFKRNQFGFTLTGPVLKERTFFMASFEGLRDRLTETVIDHFPDELARQGIITDREGKITQTVEVLEDVKPYLALYPLPNAGSLGRGVGENAASQFLPTDENFFTVRVDHKISDRDSFFARYTIDDATSHSSQATFLYKSQSNSRQQYLTLVGTHIFSPALLTSFRFGYTRPVNAEDTLSSIEVSPELFFVPGGPIFGRIDVPGLSDFGPAPTPAANVMNTFQFANDVLVNRGSHSLQLGFNLHRYRWDLFSSSNKGGVWSFNSLESFLRGGPEGTNLTVALPGSDNAHAYRQTLAGFYFQDGYQIHPRFRLNFGLRYEFVTRLNDNFGRTVFLPDPVRDTEVQFGPYLERNPSPRAPAPRLGLSWSPWADRDTVVSAGFGIYYDQFLAYVISSKKASAPFFQKIVRNNFSSTDTFPNAVAAAEGFPAQAQVLDYRHTVTPQVMRYNFAVDQPLPGGWLFQASYVGARGNHLFRVYEANLFPLPVTRADGSLFFPDDCNDPLNRNPSSNCRPDAGPVNPALGSITLISSDTQSFYNSFRIAARKRVGSGISLRSSYTYSKSVDDASSFAPRTGQYGLSRTLERGLSDFDIRHRFVVNYFYTLPFGSGRRWGTSGVLGQALGGWRMGGIVSFRTGTPFTPQIRVRTPGFLFSPTRPNLLPGRSNNPVLGGPDKYFDSSVYAVPEPGTLGNAGRNTITAPSVFRMDISLQREFLLDAKRRLQFRAEIFNVLNHPNFGRVSGGSTVVFSGESGRLNSTAGRIRETSATSRQIQFALRFSF
ncbi:MAG: TonB-dependent receptor [Acidobacteria bacterium]|nr:TonB-dependent receptor [Acidobacteriota bacterium]